MGTAIPHDKPTCDPALRIGEDRIMHYQATRRRKCVSDLPQRRVCAIVVKMMQHSQRKRDIEAIARLLLQIRDVAGDKYPPIRISNPGDPDVIRIGIDSNILVGGQVRQGVSGPAADIEHTVSLTWTDVLIEEPTA